MDKLIGVFFAEHMAEIIRKVILKWLAVNRFFYGNVY